MIATITVKDPEKFQKYLAKTQEVAASYGAERYCQVDPIYGVPTNALEYHLLLEVAPFKADHYLANVA